MLVVELKADWCADFITVLWHYSQCRNSLEMRVMVS